VPGAIVPGGGEPGGLEPGGVEPGKVQTVRGAEPRQYVCQRASGPITVDGRLGDATWKRAEWTELFVDIEGDRRPRPRHGTRAMMAWDDEHLYVAAELEEPDVWGKLTERDVMIYEDPDFEVFIWPTDGRGWPEEGTPYYYEFEVNALNTAMDMLLRREAASRGYERESRLAWDIEGLQHAVQVAGTVNWPADVDEGWTVEAAFPWKALAEYAGDTPVPPRHGDVWRVNFSRVQRVRGSGPTECDNWVWSPQGEVQMHLPDRWGYVTFSETAAGEG